VRNDLTAGKGRPFWIFSTYGPIKGLPASLLDGNEYSSEELRVRFYELKAAGNEEQANQEAVNLWTKAEQAMADVANNAEKIVEFMEAAEKKHPNHFDLLEMDGKKTRDQVTKGAESGSSFGSSGSAGFGQPGGFGQSSGTGSAFGQSTSLFGQPSSSSSGFGQPTQPSAFGQGAFGKPSTPAFGQPSSAFGQPAFGQPSQSNATFGKTPIASSGFGVPSFGQPAASSGFGAPTFGRPAVSSGFGAPSFGQPAASSSFGTSTFGQPSALAGSSAFGTRPASGGFGQTSQPTSSFGQSAPFGQPSNRPPAFGQPSTAFSQQSLPGSGFGFGGQPAPSASGFGQTSEPTSTFGQPSQPTSGFGQPSQPSVFGQPSQPSSFGQPVAGFGQLSNSSQAFSTPSAPSGGFGRPTSPEQNNPFGTKSTTATSGFGQPSQAVATNAATPFGQLTSTATTISNAFERRLSTSTNVGSSVGTAGLPGPSPNTSTTPHPLTDKPPAVVHYTQTIPSSASPTGDPITKNLTSFKGRRVQYINDVPCYERPDRRGWERIWYADRSASQDILHLNKENKVADLVAEDSKYTEDVLEGFRYLFENGRFMLGKVPLEPPKREWCIYDF